MVILFALFLRVVFVRRCFVFENQKVLLESKSLIHGRWPAFTCRKDVGEGFFSRVAYTWHGLFWLSFMFYAFFISVYNVSGLTF